MLQNINTRYQLERLENIWNACFVRMPDSDSKKLYAYGDFRIETVRQSRFVLSSSERRKKIAKDYYNNWL